MNHRKATVCALVLGFACAPALAGHRIEVLFDDPALRYAAYYADLQRVTAAAGDAWTSRLGGSDADLSVSISFADIATANGRSMAAAWVGTTGDGNALYQQGAAHELDTGIDVNGSAADIAITIGIGGFLQNELWFDPDPLLRLDTVPIGQTDAMSVLMHEFGHAFGFNGWRDGFSGALPGSYASTFDALVQPLPAPQGSALFFTGAAAVGLYGGPVPLSLGNYAHFGNEGGAGGADLLPDLMNGVAFYRGTRYTISALDLAVLQDLGLDTLSLTPVPEPATGGLWLAGAAGLLAWRRFSAAAGPPAGSAGRPAAAPVPS